VPRERHDEEHDADFISNALTIVFAVISVVQVYRIEDSEARAAWSDTQYVTAIPGDRPPGDSDH
jgi:hypothetical protein